LLERLDDMEGLSGTEFVGTATFGFLAIAAIALLGVITGARWISTRKQQQRETKKRFAALTLLLEYPGEEGARVMAAWREQEILARVRGRRQRLRVGLVALSAGIALAAMLRVLSPASGAWAIGVIPGLAGCAIAALAYFDRSASVESRA
jgi:hypothetical protein